MKQSTFKRFWHKDKQTFAHIHVLAPNRTERLPKKLETLRIQSGKAWISVRSQDVILGTGEMMAIQATWDGAVISVLGEKPVIYEINPANSESSN